MKVVSVNIRLIEIFYLQAALYEFIIGLGLSTVDCRGARRAASLATTLAHTGLPRPLSQATEAQGQKRRLTASQRTWVDREPLRTCWRIGSRDPRIAAPRVKQEHNLLRRRAHGARREISSALLLVGEGLLDGALRPPAQGWRKVPALLYVQLQHARYPLAQHRRRQSPHGQGIARTPHRSSSSEKHSSKPLAQSDWPTVQSLNTRLPSAICWKMSRSSRPGSRSRDKKKRQVSQRVEIPC